MADFLSTIFGQIEKRYKDMGDGTHAEVVALGDGEGHLGLVSSSDIVISVTPTLAAAEHAANDCLGGKLTLANALRVANGTSYLVSITVTFKAALTPGLEIVLFNADPTSSTLTDDSAFNVVAADAAKVKAIARVYSSDYTDLGVANAVSVDIDPVLVTGGATTLYAAVKNTTAVTPASASDMTIDFGFMRN